MCLVSKQKKQATILILGAGPTGLGAAYRLQELGHTNFRILEKNDFVGGLATSFTDDKGFTWDIGGHVTHSHYPYFDAVFKKHVLSETFTLQREAWVWLFEKFIPYPFQYNLRYLPEKIQKKCIEGLKKLSVTHSPTQKTRPSSQNFLSWIVQNFGEGIARFFLIPQNEKTWGHPLDTLSARWVGDRVATIDIQRALKNIREKKDDVAWGPNHIFFFPKKRGTRYIWEQIAHTLPPKNLQLSTTVQEINREKKYVLTTDGKKYSYDFLISSLPLTTFLKLSHHSLAQKAEKNLLSSTVHVVGLGLKGKTPPHLRTKCWMYFPEKEIPFFRATVFSNYSKNHVPQPGKQWSLMCEIAETSHRPFLHTAQKKGNFSQECIEKTIAGAIQAQLISSPEEVESTWLYTAPLGYPTPTLSRDKVIDSLLKTLQKESIYSRGRFGAWKYEVSNMDHSFMQGVEAVDHILLGKEEVTVWFPEKVNSR